jgi:hypothetical protein
MRKVVFGLGAVVAPMVVGALLAAGCSDENGDPLGVPGDPGDICGPCGEIGRGAVGISGDARLDGFFKALGNMRTATVTIKGDFEADIRALGATFGVEIDGAVNAAAIAQLTAAIRAEITANVDGDLTVNYQPARCEASFDVAVEAQANCEVQAGCDVDVNPGELSVACEGTCTGGCSGECSGDFSCEVQAPSIECTGRCEGACNLEAGGTCSGTCRGECMGTCSAQDGEGNCAGTCDGECTGTCELTVAAECSGTCSGKCLVNQGSAECTGEVSCRGSCDAECTGGCEGSFTPPSASAMCDASAECQASAKAEASASLECTPPQLDIDFNYAANVNAEARAEFSAKLTELRTRGIAIVQGAAKYGALLNGRVDGQVVFDPAPLEELTGEIEGLVSANAFADFDIPIGKIACVLPAFQEAADIVGELATDTGTTLQAQAAFVTAFTSGFQAGT